jgi:hexokinase
LNRLCERVTEFMAEHRMDCRNFKVTEQARAFAEEMRRGLAGKGGSLRMIPTFFDPTECAGTGGPVIVLDAGGTNLRRALVSLPENGEPVVEEFLSCTMPGTNSVIEAEEFFDRIAAMMLPVADRSDTVAFCFSFASSPMPDGDSVVEEVGKQLRVEGLVGKKLGVELNRALRKAGCRSKKRVAVLNDSVAALLGGIAANAARRYDGYISLILGTGINAAYVEKTVNVPKISGNGYGSENLIINTESGGYGGFPRGDLDDRYDAGLLDSGKCPYEKMVSGRYQGGLTLTVLRQAAEEGLFSAGFAQGLCGVSDLSAKQLDEFLAQPDGDNPLAHCCGGSETQDAMTVFYILDLLAERAARMVAANLAALMMQMGSGRNPLRPTCVAADGSTFYKSRLFRKKLHSCIARSLNGELGLYCEFVSSPNGNLPGSAVAGLSIEKK